MEKQPEQPTKLRISHLQKMKQEHRPIAMVTAYDYPSAKLVEEAGADVILVGDSLGMVVLGYDSTIPVTMDDMVHHTKAVTRAVKRSFVVSDLPFASYHGSIDETLRHAARLMQEGLSHAVKMEGGAEIASTVTRCVQAGIPVVGHLGLTPQSIHQIGGYKVQGNQEATARKLLDDAKALEQAGACMLVLEMVPEALAAFITEQLSIPTIGIGAGRSCDGQVLVYHDLLQYASPVTPRFVKTYADVQSMITSAIAGYVEDVRTHAFPEEKHTFTMPDGMLDRIRTGG